MLDLEYISNKVIKDIRNYLEMPCETVSVNSTIGRFLGQDILDLEIITNSNTRYVISICSNTEYVYSIYRSLHNYGGGELVTGPYSDTFMKYLYRTINEKEVANRLNIVFEEKTL